MHRYCVPVHSPCVQLLVKLFTALCLESDWIGLVYFNPKQSTVFPITIGSFTERRQSNIDRSTYPERKKQQQKNNNKQTSVLKYKYV